MKVSTDTTDSSPDAKLDMAASIDMNGLTDVPRQDTNGEDRPIVDVGDPDKQRPNDGPLPDFLRAEHAGVCPVEPPKDGDACTLDDNQGCGYRPVCDTGTPVHLDCGCRGGKWVCDQGGYCRGN